MATKDQLRAKATGFVKGIGGMKPKEREASPSQQYGEDYNRLRDMVEQLDPGLKDLLPPKVEIVELAYGGYVSRQRFGEILTYAEQIDALLA